MRNSESNCKILLTRNEVLSGVSSIKLVLMSVLRTEKLNKIVYKIFIYILLIDLFDFSAVRPIDNPEADYYTVTYSFDVKEKR